MKKINQLLQNMKKYKRKIECTYNIYYIILLIDRRNS